MSYNVFMLLIAGLGNPGKKYAKTRHNIGFMAVDALAKDFGVNFKDDKKKNAQIAEYIMTFPNQKKKVRIVLAKPQTFMNNSGEAITKISKYYGIKPSSIWIIHDDIDIDLGIIRIRYGGSSAGQKGVQSIIDHLKTTNFYRFRFGIKPQNKKIGPTEKFVLKNFSNSEQSITKIKIKELIEVIKESCDRGIENTTL